MMVPRIVLAGAGSGVGKTTVATGLMRRLSRRKKVQGFKVGPDFIDPMFHTAATGRPSRNLDSFMLEPEALNNLFGWSTADADIAVVEGVRGLYDGLTATGETGSTAEIAKMLGAPVILVVNARSLAKSAAAVVLGFKMLDPEVRIAGVILNQVSGPKHRDKAIEAVESLAGVEVVGAIGRGEKVPERHLGLILKDSERTRTMDLMESMTQDIDIERILEIASEADGRHFKQASPFVHRPPSGVRIAVPRDRAYCFYYPENIEALTAAGAEVVPFCPTDGDDLPNCDAVYLGGGYPEEHAAALAANRGFMDGLRTLSHDGVVYGECGGLMTMCSSVRAYGEEHSMSGIFPSTAVLTDERHGPSYVRATGTADNFLLPGQAVRGHEFHYSHLEPMPDGRFGFAVERGAGIGRGFDGITIRRTMGTYMHLHALSCPGWAPALVSAAAV